MKFGSVHDTGRFFGSIHDYRDEFLKLGEDVVSAMRIRTGLEVDYSPRFEHVLAEFVNREEWDILLCSVHEFDNSLDVERNLEHDSGLGASRRWREYFRLEQLALESDFVDFDVLAPPVRMSRGLALLPSDIDELLLNLTVIAKKRGRLWN